MADESMFEKAKEFMYRNWQTHMQAFGPILAPAFSEDLQARLRLLVALNHISQRQCTEGRQILLKELKDRCQNDQDLAAYRFFMGLSFEMEGNRVQMRNWYSRCCKLKHNFFMPHLKLAKFYHGEMFYDQAVTHYQTAIELLKKEKDRDPAVLGATYANLTGCLTMMHDFKAAEAAWFATVQFPLQTNSYATAAMLYAAKGDREKAYAYLGQIDEKFQDLIQGTTASIEKVLTKQHPHFNRIAVDPQKITDFWKWFVSQEERFTQRSPKIFDELAKQVQAVLPFMPHFTRYRCMKQKDGYFYSFCDFYSISVHYGLAELLRACPQDLQMRWNFSVIH